jgi:hypothetical protein
MYIRSLPEPIIPHFFNAQIPILVGTFQILQINLKKHIFTFSLLSGVLHKILLNSNRIFFFGARKLIIFFQNNIPGIPETPRFSEK